MDNQQYHAESELPKPPQKQSQGGVWVSLPVCILCVLLAGLFVFMATYVPLSLKMEREINRAYGEAAKYEKLLEVAELYDQYYYYGVNQSEASERLARFYGMAIGDVYNSYYTAEEWEESYNASIGNATGIGVYVSMNEDGQIVVLRVMKNSPAEKAGILQGDIILSVDDIVVQQVGYESAMDHILGKIGTVVSLGILRGETTFTLEITRGKYTPQTVFAETVTVEDSLYGYIYISGFEGTTKTDFISAINALRQQGAKGLVFDVRDNPGGDFNVIVDVLDILLPEGPIVHVQEADAEPYTFYSDDEEVNLPMVVLTNGNTASAAELFVSALKDYEKAVIVGEKTFGKGCGQTGQFLSDGSIVFITNFLYTPPFSENYNGVGITPDYEIELDKAFRYVNILLVPHEQDNQLSKAIDLLHEMNR